MFARRKTKLSVTEGAVFRRVRQGAQIGTARVLAVSEDGAGIPHVRFAVHYDGPQPAEELRTLALASFFEMFPEPVSA